MEPSMMRHRPDCGVTRNPTDARLTRVNNTATENGAGNVGTLMFDAVLSASTIEWMTAPHWGLRTVLQQVGELDAVIP
jgi:hypothetical protein